MTSAPGTKRTWCDVRSQSVMRIKTDVRQRASFMSSRHDHPYSLIAVSLIGFETSCRRVRTIPPCLRQINPTGKISLSPSGKSRLRLPPSCPLRKGRWPSSPNVGMGCGGRSGIVRAMGSQGGINSVSGQRTRWRAVPKRTAKSRGSDASKVGVKSQRRRESPTGPDRRFPGGDGGSKARYSGVSAI